MVRFRCWLWLNTVGLTITFGLTGCGSSQNAGTVTPVTTTTTNVVQSKPGAGHVAPNMASNPAAMAAHGGPTAPPGGTSSGATMNPAAMMAHSGGSAMPPGGSAMPPRGPAGGDSSASMDPATMKAHSGGGAAAPPGGASSAAMDPAATMKAHFGGTATPPGGAAGATMDPAAMMKAHGNAAPAGGAAGTSMPGAAGGALAGASSGSDMPSGPMGGPGGPRGGGGPVGPGGQQGTNFPAGSVEDTIYRFCVAMADGDTAAAAEYLGSKAKGLVGQLREGELSDEKVEEIKTALTPVTDLQPNQGQNNTKRSLRNKKNQVISFTMKKDKDDDRFKIVELSVSKPKSR